jgi:hypothetical protein
LHVNQSDSTTTFSGSTGQGFRRMNSDAYFRWVTEICGCFRLVHDVIWLQTNEISQELSMGTKILKTSYYTVLRGFSFNLKLRK